MSCLDFRQLCDGDLILYCYSCLETCLENSYWGGWVTMAAKYRGWKGWGGIPKGRGEGIQRIIRRRYATRPLSVTATVGVHRRHEADERLSVTRVPRWSRRPSGRGVSRPADAPIGVAWRRRHARDFRDFASWVVGVATLFNIQSCVTTKSRS